jgi:hypothetical protein
MDISDLTTKQQPFSNYEKKETQPQTKEKTRPKQN